MAIQNIHSFSLPRKENGGIDIQQAAIDVASERELPVGTIAQLIISLEPFEAVGEADDKYLASLTDEERLGFMLGVNLQFGMPSSAIGNPETCASYGDAIIMAAFSGADVHADNREALSRIVAKWGGTTETVAVTEVSSGAVN